MTDYKEIAVLGDSIANGFFDPAGIGWVGRMVQALNEERPYSCYYNNYAVAGDRVYDAWHRLCADVVSRRPDLLLIAVGANDVLRWNAPDHPVDVSPDTRDEFWTLLLETAGRTIEKTAVLGMLPVDEMRMPLTGAFDKKVYYRNADIQVYNTYLAEKCAASDCLFLDVYDSFLAAGGPAFLYDAIHPNADGHAWIAAFCCKALKEAHAL